MTDRRTLRLGLIGDNIAGSHAPLLHRLAGRQNGLDVCYDRLVPPERRESFEQVFDACALGGYRGINVTYPYKERAVRHVRIDDPAVRAIGAVNTVLFGPDGPRGHNTDHTGFMSAYRTGRGGRAPGIVLMIGAGGVGRAVAFGLAKLGARELRLSDRDPDRAQALAAALRPVAGGMRVSIWDEPETAAGGAQGLINCTPVGMDGYGGTPLPSDAMRGAEWAFDAVYTPVETRFLVDAAAAGLSVVSGWELFFFQGVQAWALFSGAPLDERALRAQLLDPETAV
ncbi:shikimate dehydrogenase [Rhodobacteraceae bacterium 2CG4]|uniref:Shikimate dehydrogenase n=1 Tax=Halovulum marinum TaxID=2662447 RepID=A0A6L5Z135_9RHOB|nr:shikimate dehydrogenase [Halovulum marinum]MSU90261.1 shikimate dehydrogenase [Halovulum marinum]